MQFTVDHAMTTRRKFLAGIVLATAGMASPAALAQDADPKAQIMALNDALLQIMHAGHAVPFAKRKDMLRPVVAQVFDLPLLLRNSVGALRWPGLPDAQKADLLTVFSEFTLASFVANFDAFNGETFAIAPQIRKVDGDAIVETRMVPPTGDPTRLDYVMRNIDGSWRVVDILLDGTISRVAVTRSDFRSMIAQGDASRLIASLRGKVEALTAGAAP